MEFSYQGNAKRIFNEMENIRKEVFVDEQDFTKDVRKLIDKFIAYKAMVAFATYNSEHAKQSQKDMKALDRGTLPVAQEIGRAFNDAFDKMSKEDK